MRKKMSEVDGVLRTMEFGVSTGLRLAKDTLELMLRFVNFLIARYEKSKEFNMKYEEMNKAQRQRRNGYLQAKQMKKIMEKTGECMVPIALENGREMSEAELDKLAMYAEMMNFPYTFLEEEIVDRDGNLVLDEEGYPKVKRTYFVLQSDLDKMNIFVQTLNRDRQHEIVEKSDLMPEEKDQLHDDINAENTFGDNEKVVKETVVRNKEFHEALKKAYEEKDYSMLEKVMKDEKIKFYNSPEQAKGGEKNNFTIVMNKNARRDYSRGQNYYVVDAINPNHYIELTSTYNEKQKRTDTSYTVYKNSEVIFETNDRLTDEDVQKAAVTKSWKGWNPRWNEIREEIKEAGGFKQDAHYFVFNTQAEFENYRSLYEQNVERYTIKPEDIINGMDYTEAKATIDMQMKTNHFFVQMREQGLSQGEIEKNRLSEQDLSKYEAAQQVDYRIFVNNMTQKETISKLEELQTKIIEKQNELQQINMESPIQAMDQNEEILNQIDDLKGQHDLHAKLLLNLSSEERMLLASQAEQITEEKSKNQDASKFLNNYRAKNQIKENNLDLKDYSREQQEEIKKGLANGLSIEQVKNYMDLNIRPEEMEIRRIGFEEGLKNVEIEHCVKLYWKTKDYQIIDNAMAGYNAGLTREQIELCVDIEILPRVREQLMEGIIEKIPENKLLVIKDATKNKKTEQVEYVSILLKFAKENAITLENMQQITEIDSVDALNNIYSGYKSGISMEELKPAFEKDIMPEQINGIVKILVDEKKNLKSKQGEKSKEPSKIQFQKAHQWAERQNQRMNLNKEQSKTVSKEQVENIR